MDERTKEAHDALDKAIAEHGHGNVEIYVHHIGCVWVGVKHAAEKALNEVGEAAGEAMDQR